MKKILLSVSFLSLAFFSESVHAEFNGSFEELNNKIKAKNWGKDDILSDDSNPIADNLADYFKLKAGKKRPDVADILDDISMYGDDDHAEFRVAFADFIIKLYAGKFTKDYKFGSKSAQGEMKGKIAYGLRWAAVTIADHLNSKPNDLYEIYSKFNGYSLFGYKWGESELVNSHKKNCQDLLIQALYEHDATFHQGEGDFKNSEYFKKIEQFNFQKKDGRPVNAVENILNAITWKEGERQRRAKLEQQGYEELEKARKAKAAKEKEEAEEARKKKEAEEKKEQEAKAEALRLMEQANAERIAKENEEARLAEEARIEKERKEKEEADKKAEAERQAKLKEDKKKAAANQLKLKKIIKDQLNLMPEDVEDIVISQPLLQATALIVKEYTENAVTADKITILKALEPALKEGLTVLSKDGQQFDATFKQILNNTINKKKESASWDIANVINTLKNIGKDHYEGVYRETYALFIYDKNWGYSHLNTRTTAEIIQILGAFNEARAKGFKFDQNRAFATKIKEELVSNIKEAPTADIVKVINTLTAIGSENYKSVCTAAYYLYGYTSYNHEYSHLSSIGVDNVCRILNVLNQAKKSGFNFEFEFAKYVRNYVFKSVKDAKIDDVITFINTLKDIGKDNTESVCSEAYDLFKNNWDNSSNLNKQPMDAITKILMALSEAKTAGIKFNYDHNFSKCIREKLISDVSKMTSVDIVRAINKLASFGQEHYETIAGVATSLDKELKKIDFDKKFEVLDKTAEYKDTKDLSYIKYSFDYLMKDTNYILNENRLVFDALVKAQNDKGIKVFISGQYHDSNTYAFSESVKKAISINTSVGINIAKVIDTLAIYGDTHYKTVVDIATTLDKDLKQKDIKEKLQILEKAAEYKDIKYISDVNGAFTHLMGNSKSSLASKMLVFDALVKAQNDKKLKLRQDNYFGGDKDILNPFTHKVRQVLSIDTSNENDIVQIINTLAQFGSEHYGNAVNIAMVIDRNFSMTDTPQKIKMLNDAFELSKDDKASDALYTIKELSLPTKTASKEDNKKLFKALMDASKKGLDLSYNNRTFFKKTIDRLFEDIKNIKMRTDDITAVVNVLANKPKDYYEITTPLTEGEKLITEATCKDCSSASIATLVSSAYKNALENEKFSQNKFKGFLKIIKSMCNHDDLRNVDAYAKAAALGGAFDDSDVTFINAIYNDALDKLAINASKALTKDERVSILDASIRFYTLHESDGYESAIKKVNKDQTADSLIEAMKNVQKTN